VPVTATHGSKTALMTLTSATVLGAGQAALCFCKALRRSGWRVVVIWGPSSRKEEGTAAVQAMEEAGVEVHTLTRLVGPTAPVWFSLRGVAKTNQPDVVIGVMQRDRPIAMALSRSLGVPGVVAAQNQHIFWGSPVVSWAKRLIYTFAIRNWASLVVCTSERVRDEIESFGVSRDRTTVLPNGISPEPVPSLTTAERNALRAELGAGPESTLLLNVGRLDPQKGQDILVEAFATCARRRRRVQLALIGGITGGAAKNRTVAFNALLRDRVEKLGISDRVRFVGWRSDVQKLLAVADGYVHASRWEGFSFAMLEAMAASLPVVITDCSGTPEGFIESKHGWIVSAGDTDALAQAIAYLADLTPEARSSMGEAGRRLVEERYESGAIGSRFVELVSRVVNAHHRSDWRLKTPVQ
jgi:glycosyltransferase involved in cell wall biosynthesis